MDATIRMADLSIEEALGQIKNCAVLSKLKGNLLKAKIGRLLHYRFSSKPICFDVRQHHCLKIMMRIAPWLHRGFQMEELL